MDHTGNANSALPGIELVQIFEGNCDEICSAHFLLAHMPGDIKCHQHVSQTPAPGKERLQVFWYPESILNQIQQKIKCLLLSLPESVYLGTFNLVQFWEPVVIVTAGGGLTHTLLSVSKQPFGVDQISKGVCRYRYFSVMNEGLVSESDPVGKAFTYHLPGFFMNVGEDYSQSQQTSFAQGCGFQTCWVFPLVRVHGMLLTPECVGVLEFLTRGDIRFDFTLMDKFKQLSKHVTHALNSPSENGVVHHMVPYVQNYRTFDTVQLHQAPDGGLSTLYNHSYTQYLASSSNISTPCLVDATADQEQPLQVPTKENMRGKNVARCEIPGNIIEELGSLVSADDDSNSNTQDTAQTCTTGIGKHNVTKAMIIEQFGKDIEDAADALGVSKSTLKRYCRHYHIQRWPSHKRNKVHAMSVKATYKASNVVFSIKSNMEIEVLRGELGRRFGLGVGSFRIEYRDENGERIMLPCTEDLKEHMNTLKSSKEKTMHLLISLPSGD